MVVNTEPLASVEVKVSRVSCVDESNACVLSFLSFSLGPSSPTVLLLVLSFYSTSPVIVFSLMCGVQREL